MWVGLGGFTLLVLGSVWFLNGIFSGKRKSDQNNEAYDDDKIYSDPDHTNDM